MRGGFNAIPKEQYESAYALGYSKIDSLRFIIFLQLLRNILPALTGEFDSLLKSTAILYPFKLKSWFFSQPKLTRMGMNIVSREMDLISIYLAVARFYVAISATSNIVSKKK